MTSGQTSSDKSRELAAKIMKEKVMDAYSPSSEEWKKYHSAWQNYYQNYYNSYYSKAAKEYLAKEKEKLKSSKTEPENPNDTPFTRKLRSKIRENAEKKKKLSDRRKKLIPLFAGLSVTIAILFLQYDRLLFAPIVAYMSPGESPASSIEAIDPTVSAAVSADPKLIIPKINVEVPVAFGISLGEVDNAMKSGVAHYRISGASAFPGEFGNTVITGHSAGDIYSNNPYKFIFSGLERLEEKDLIYINYNSTRYTYSVTKKIVIEPNDISALTETSDKPTLILVTCTPLGTSRYRLLVFAEQVSPSYDNAMSAEPSTETVKKDADLPSNEPAFFENIWSWLTGND